MEFTEEFNPPVYGLLTHFPLFPRPLGGVKIRKLSLWLKSFLLNVSIENGSTFFSRARQQVCRHSRAHLLIQTMGEEEQTESTSCLRACEL